MRENHHTARAQQLTSQLPSDEIRRVSPWAFEPPVHSQNSIRTENGAILIGNSAKTLNSTKNCFRVRGDSRGVGNCPCARMAPIYKDE